jgi:DNA-binding NtrC family response regulator
MKTILLIDGNFECLTGHADLLNRSGYEVIAALDAQSALTAMRDGGPIDLVIIDEQINGMDSFDLLSSLQKYTPGPSLIMLSACGTIEKYLKALRMGVFEYVNKPAKAREFVRIVNAALDRTRIGDYINSEPHHVI